MVSLATSAYVQVCGQGLTVEHQVRYNFLSTSFNIFNTIFEVAQSTVSYYPIISQNIPEYFFTLSQSTFVIPEYYLILSQSTIPEYSLIYYPRVLSQCSILHPRVISQGPILYPRVLSLVHYLI